MSSTPLLSFQLYTSRDAQSVETLLSDLAALSYENVEPYDALIDDPAQLAAQLAHNGLTARSGHFALDTLEAEPAKIIAAAKTLGMEIVVTPWLDEHERPVDAPGWKALGARLAALRARLAEDGLRLGWHNHDFEFRALDDGSFPIEHLMEGTGLELELDLAWVLVAGQEPLVWMERYGARIFAVHVKDKAPEGENLDEEGWTDIGHGTIDWAGLWPQVMALSPEMVVIEHDAPKDWRAFAEVSVAAVKKIMSDHAAAKEA